MPYVDTEEPTVQPSTAALGKYLHAQADEIAAKADQLDAYAAATHSEAEAIEAEADQMWDRAEHLHQQADKVDQAIEH